MLEKEQNITKSISYLNLAAQSPSLEINLSLSEKIHQENSNNKHVIFMCDRALLSCSVNVLNKKSICNLCRHKAIEGYKIFKKRNKNAELVKISRKDLLSSEQSSLSQKTKKEILFGVHSTIGSQLRLDNMELLDRRWKKIERKRYYS